MQISVIIPAFNEQKVIESTLKEVFEYLEAKFESYEVIVVDDASRDDTAQIVAGIPRVQLVRHHPNHGKGYAVRQGVLRSTGELILFMDADNSTKINELDHFLEEIKGCDVVVGSRALKSSDVIVKQNALKQLLGRIGNRYIQVVLGLSIRDTQCGFKLYRSSVRSIFKIQKLDQFGFDFEVLFLAYKKSMRIYESPVRWVNNFDSSVTMRSYLRSLVDVMRIRIWYHLGHYSLPHI